MIGFLGAFTNYSAFSLDALGLWQNGGHILATVYVIITVVLCLFAATGVIWPTRLIKGNNYARPEASTFGFK